MPTVLKAGMRLFGAAGTTEVVVVKAPSHPVDLRIGGHPALTDADARQPGVEVTTPAGAKAAVGKRYVDATGELEVLCTKAGHAGIAVGDELLVLKEAKPLPASD